MHFEQYADRVLAHGRVSHVRPFAHITEGGRAVPVAAGADRPGGRTLLITAGFHGDETAGPLTLLEHFPEIVRLRDRARRRPAASTPASTRPGSRTTPATTAVRRRPTTIFLRYEIAPGGVGGRAGAGQSFLRHGVFTDGPKETRALAAELETLPTPARGAGHPPGPLHPGPAELRLQLRGQRAPSARCWRRPSALVPRRPQLPGRRRRLHRRRRPDPAARRQRDRLLLPPGRALHRLRSRPPRRRRWTAATQVDLIWIRGFIDLASGS